MYKEYWPLTIWKGPATMGTPHVGQAGNANRNLPFGTWRWTYWEHVGYAFSLSLSLTCFAVFGWNSGGEFIGHRVDGKVGHTLHSTPLVIWKLFVLKETKVCRIWWNLKGGFKSLKGYGTALLFRVFRGLQMEKSFEDFREAAEMMNGRIF